MSKEVKLRAEKRDERGKEAARSLRANGRVPAVLYGKGTESVSLSVEAHEAEMLFQSISVENTIIGLEIDGDRKPVPALIREIQAHPYKPMLYHVDFYRIREGETLELEIPVHLIGVPEGVRTSGGVLQQTIHEVAVRCLPTQIPSSFDVDVAHLGVGDSVHVSDIQLGEGVEVLLDPDQVICSVVVPKAAAPAAAEAAEAAEGVEGEPGAEQAETTEE
jgi:large subunit ribosomal protein L25